MSLKFTYIAKIKLIHIPDLRLTLLLHLPKCLYDDSVSEVNLLKVIIPSDNTISVG